MTDAKRPDENVDAFMAEHESADVVLEKFNEEYRKFKYLEQRLTEQKEVMNQKLPEIQRALDTIKYLQEQKKSAASITTQFELSDHIWAEAQIPPTDTVFLFLGASTMVEYPLEEAFQLLTNNLTQGKKSLAKFDEDLDYLKDQITVSEVNMARVFNWNVKNKKATVSRKN